MAMDIGKIDFGSAIAVGPPKNLSDGVHTEFTGGNMGQLMTADIWGKYGEFCRRGWVYTASGTLLTIPVYTTLTNGPALWNPAGSGKLVVPLKILLSAGGLGTPVITGLVGCFLNGAGSTAATGAPVITWTNIDDVCKRRCHVHHTAGCLLPHGTQYVEKRYGCDFASHISLP
jgi:hypothetical protein